VLTDHERASSSRYIFARDRTRSAASRGLLRHLLGTYLGIEPEEVRLRFGPQGRPELDEAHAGSGVRFNVAHADDLAVYALTHQREVGVDVERIHPMPDATDIAVRFFAAAEIAALRALPPREIDQAFFLCWTRKEAYIKALGGGLSIPLDEFEVDLRPSDRPSGVRVPADPARAASWSLHDLWPAPSFVGSVCVAGHDLELRSRHWAAQPELNRAQTHPSRLDP
jgi:4'-phosphopantetheinyl transferase